MPALTATAPAATPFEEPEEPARPALSLAQARGEDAHWERCHQRECYYRPGRDYEDYAPAYCAGYVGYAQYGGSFEDAERSLVSNWIRIRGGSRLDLDEAMAAMRAAWRRMEQAAARALHWDRWLAPSDDAAAVLEADLEIEAGLLQATPAAWQRAAPQALTAQP